MKSKYNRIILKLSGECLTGGNEDIDPTALNFISKEIIKLSKLGIELGIVIGGGNIWRGGRQHKISRVTADYMGMLATQINSLALQDTLEAVGIPTVVLSAIEMTKVSEFYVRNKALKYFKKGYVLIFSCGTGNPYFTTDTTAALRAIELDADVYLKATQVDGVYDKDPKKNKDAVKYTSLIFKEAIDKQLAVMDITAFTLCMEYNLPIVVFNFYKAGNIEKVARGEKIGTVITNG